jgi:ABC-type oligopeptide transport system substrate-binding subunit/class 3 adenylate cyclase
MRCPHCQFDSPSDFAFCPKCGTALQRTCAHCGFRASAEFAFCPKCGSALAGPPQGPAREPEAEPLVERLQRLVPKEFAERLLGTRGQVGRERRTVTILFSDVKGSMAMAEELDPEDWMEIMDGAFEVLIEPVYRYEGTLARLMGDAVLAFFGAPIAHEDDPERACRAALDIIAGAQEYAERLERERGIQGFNVRVGIHTGLVVVGEVGSDLRVEYTAMGDAVNLAARMESAAEPGTVLITEDTHKLVAPLFDSEPLGPIEVKGKAQPVPAYRVLAPKMAPGKPRGIAGLESRLVGRETELAALQAALERLEAGVGGVVTIVGEAGIGKSRLVAEVRKKTLAKVLKPSQGWSRALHLTWVEGRCLSYGASIAYLLWLDVLRGLLGVTVEDAPVDVRDALEKWVRALCPERFEDGFDAVFDGDKDAVFDPVKDAVYPYLGRLMSLPLEEEVEGRLEDLDGRELKERTFRAVEMLLACAAADRPLVLVCEDLHWSGPSSLALLEHLLSLTVRVPLLLICVFRAERDHGSWQLRETVGRDYRQWHTDLWLQPLSGVESETLVGNLLWVEDLPEQLKGRILDHAGGNPFFLEEVLRSLIDEGAIVQDGATGRWQATRDVGDIAIPDTLQGLLLARIDRLQEETKRVLQMAAVIGRIFLYRVLEAIAAAEAAVEEQALERRLVTLQDEEMIRERTRIPELEYIFKHHLTQEAAYNGLLKRERRIYHRQVGEALERLFPDRVEEQVGLLAHHWERAGDAEKAVEYLQRAGDQARLAYAHEEAVAYYERALALLKAGEEQEPAARMLMKLGLTHHNAFQYQRAREAYAAGFALWQRAGTTQVAAVLPPAPHPLRVQWYEPRSLDAGATFAEETMMTIGQLFSGLLELTPEMDLMPDVARSWEVLEGGRKYVFHLRDDVRWSDGTALTAGDFEYAWKRVLDPAIDSPCAILLDDVEGARAFHRGEAGRGDVGVRALDEVTLAVWLERPTAYFLHLAAECATYPVPRHVVEAHGEAWTEPDNLVTNGPFRLETWRRGESLGLVRNASYHGRFTGNVQRVEESFISEPQTPASRLAELERYEAGRLDVVLLKGMDSVEVERARQRHAGEYVSAPELGVYYLEFDVSRPPFDDRRVRQAFIHATDRETLINVAMRGRDFPATGGFVPVGMPGHAPGIALPYDPQRARELLAEAGYPDGRDFPTVLFFPFQRLIPEGEQLRLQWSATLGIETTVPATSKSAHMVLLGWGADYPDPDDFLRVAIRDTASWRNEDYDRLVEEARRLTDQRRRMELYAQAERILVEDAPLMPLGYGRHQLLVKPWVSRFPVSPVNWQLWKDVVIEPH